MNSKVQIERVGGTIISYATSGKFSDEDLDRLIKYWIQPGVFRYFAYNEGSIEISPKQRDEAKNNLRGIQVVAIVESAVMRGVVTAFRWIGLPVAAFSPAKLDEAIGSLGLSKDDALEVTRTIHRLRSTSLVRVAS